MTRLVRSLIAVCLIAVTAGSALLASVALGSKRRLPLTRIVAGPVLFRVTDTPNDGYTAPKYIMVVRLSRYARDNDSSTFADTSLGNYSFFNEASEPDVGTLLHNRKCVMLLVGRDLPEPGLNRLRVGQRATVVLRPLTPYPGPGGISRLGPRRVRNPILGLTDQNLTQAIPAIRRIGCPKPTLADYPGYSNRRQRR